MEKARGVSSTNNNTKVKTNYLCIPRLRNNNNNNNHNNSCTTKKKGLTPAMTLLDRFREAVFRLIMFSAFSPSSKTASSTVLNRDGSTPEATRCYRRPGDDHMQSEAVADCIEFIKKKAMPFDHNNNNNNNRDSNNYWLFDGCDM
ncbi:hypothetical protein G4B88_016922 [Cannabis sativa]|uniref:Uncharacterized protein n=1 Tax=Cannabis sativa TaxID=3483 RepID=A0A7J6FPT0_CANSA|nr:hypothetical protein G4B88_016922 [Cannabis sativa]